jgi:hypothetical protein
MGNVVLSNGKEADLLAFDPHTNERYHVEVHVITRGFKIRLIDTKTSRGIAHRRGLDTIDALKFSPPSVVNGIKQIFGCEDYKKILVIWETENQSVIDEAKKRYDIQIWLMPEIMRELSRKIKTSGYRDDILRTIQLLSMPAANKQTL